jgi:hypothetical protein
VNPYVFFVGCPRSGTTVFQRMADSHRKLAIVGELHWVPRWWIRRRGITADGMVTPELVRRVIAHAHFNRLGLTAEQVSALVAGDTQMHYAEFVSRLLDLHGETKGKRHVGIKTPQYVLHAPTLHALWPEARFVHLVRDGRDVALSLLDWRRAQPSLRAAPWSEDPVVSTALFWESHVRLGLEAASVLGSERYLEIRYERLVADPERECRRLCDFLGLAYDPGMLRFHERRARPGGAVSAKKAWLPVTAGLRDWRGQMSPRSVATFEAVAGALLDELGYARGADPAIAQSDAELARVERLRVAFIEDARARREAVPGAWQAMAV